MSDSYSDGYYDVAQICLAGHVANSMARQYPTSNKAFCDKCGERTITACPSSGAGFPNRVHPVVDAAFLTPGIIGGTRHQSLPACRLCRKPASPFVVRAEDLRNLRRERVRRCRSS